MCKVRVTKVSNMPKLKYKRILFIALFPEFYMFDFYSVQFRLVPTVDVLFSLQFLCFSLALVFVFVIDMGGFAGVSEQDVTQYSKANNYRQPQSHRHLSPSKHMHQSLVSLTAFDTFDRADKDLN